MKQKTPQSFLFISSTARWFVSCETIIAGCGAGNWAIGASAWVSWAVIASEGMYGFPFSERENRRVTEQNSHQENFVSGPAFPSSKKSPRNTSEGVCTISCYPLQAGAFHVKQKTSPSVLFINSTARWLVSCETTAASCGAGNWAIGVGKGFHLKRKSIIGYRYQEFNVVKYRKIIGLGS